MSLNESLWKFVLKKPFSSTSKRGVSIRMRLQKQGSSQLECLGEASSTIGDLVDHCQKGNGTEIILNIPDIRILIA